MILGALLKEGWDWGAKFIAPIGLSFALGLLTHAKLDADARARDFEKADKETAAAIVAVGTATVSAISDARGVDEKRAKEYETLQNAISGNRAPTDACGPDDPARQRMRLKTEAANEFVARALSGGIGASDREE